VKEIFLNDTKMAYSKMLAAPGGSFSKPASFDSVADFGDYQTRAAGKKELKATKPKVVQVDDLLSFRPLKEDGG